MKSRTVLALILCLLLAVPVFAQEATPEPTPDTSPTQEIPIPETGQQWLILIAIIAAFIVLGTALIMAVRYLAKSMPVEQAKLQADNIERVLKMLFDFTQRSVNPWDNFLYSVGEPFAKEVVKILRSRGQEVEAAQLEAAIAKAQGLPAPVIPPNIGTPENIKAALEGAQSRQRPQSVLDYAARNMLNDDPPTPRVGTAQPPEFRPPGKPT